MITEKEIIEAWVFLRKNNSSIPDEVLDFMKHHSLKALHRKNELILPEIKDERTIKHLEQLINLTPTGELRELLTELNILLQSQKDVGEELYYIQDTSRGYVGNSLMWWKHNDCGYVCDIKQARVWTKEEAEKMCKEADDLRMWRKDYIDKRIQHHIDTQTIDNRNSESGSKQWDYNKKDWR